MKLPQRDGRPPVFTDMLVVPEKEPRVLQRPQEGPGAHQSEGAGHTDDGASVRSPRFNVTRPDSCHYCT